MSPPELPRPRHEERDMRPWLMWPLGAGMAGMVLFAGAIAWWAYPQSLRPRAVPDPARIFATPRLQRDTAADMAAFKAAEDATLNSYGWVDKAHGIVHVPVEQAMRKLAADGIPGWPAAKAPQ